MWIVLAMVRREVVADEPFAALERAADIVVMIRTQFDSSEYPAAGILFARTPDALYVVTASHVVRPGGRQPRRILVAFHDQKDRWIEAAVRKTDPAKDIAVLTVSDLAAIAVKREFDRLPTEDLAKLQGSAMYAIGQGGGRPWDKVMRPGWVSETTAAKIVVKFDSDVVPVPGDSGGALLNSDGEFLGIFGKIGYESRDASVVRSDVLIQLLREEHFPISLTAHVPMQTAISGANLSGPFRHVRFFRTYVSTIAGERNYIGEVDPTSPGFVYSVSSDDSGRVTQVVALRDGRTQSELRLHYSNRSSFVDAYDSLSGGKIQSTVRIQRNGAGYRTREDVFQPDGSHIGYRTYQYNGQEVDVTYYTAGNDRPAKYVRQFSTSGMMRSERSFTEDGVAYYETTLDPSSGLRVLRTKVTNSHVEVIYRPTHDEFGDVTREDFYNENNVWFGYNAYARGLLVLKRYKFPNSFTREIAVVYDVDRRPREARLSVNGKHICTLRAERTPSGNLIKTIALSPSGELWAEYPGVWVNEVTRDGNALDSSRSILHRKGVWW